MKIGLVLEGGGMRGVFVEGVTSWLIENNIALPYVIGVSMGAINGTNYVSKQPSRNLGILQEFINDHRYISKRNLITKGGLFGMDFIFNDIANIHHPFDFDAFAKNNQELVIGAMNCHLGTTSYFYKSKEPFEDLMKALEASASLPFVAKKVMLNNEPYLDGGITDPIPVMKAFEDGCDKVIVVLTQPENYVKRAFKGSKASDLIYRKYPKVTNALNSRHYIYTKSQHLLKALENEGKALIIRPIHPLDVSRTEKDIRKVETAFKIGYQLAEDKKDTLLEFINTRKDK